MGLKPRILVADLDIVKQVLIKDISIFTNRPVNDLIIIDITIKSYSSSWFNIFRKSIKLTNKLKYYLLGCSSRNTNAGVFKRSEMERNPSYFNSNIQFT